MFKLYSHKRHRCSRCASRLRKRGVLVEDIAGVRQFVCIGHMVELVAALSEPESVQTVCNDNTVDPSLAVAHVYGYFPGIGSQIDREE